MARGRRPRPGRGAGRTHEVSRGARTRAPVDNVGGDQEGVEQLGDSRTQQLEAQVVDTRGQLTTPSGMFQQFLQQQATAAVSQVPPPAQSTPATTDPPAAPEPIATAAMTTTTMTTLLSGVLAYYQRMAPVSRRGWQSLGSSTCRSSLASMTMVGQSSVRLPTWRSWFATFTSTNRIRSC